MVLERIANPSIGESRFLGSSPSHSASFSFWGFSSSGRAAALQAVGDRFESDNLHQNIPV
jgi:hypothetical protein